MNKGFISKGLWLTLLIAGLIFIHSCGERRPMLPNVTGRAGEVVLVMNAPVWESEAGKEMNRILTAEYPALPQAEHMFDVRRIPHGSFSNIFKTHRNLVVVNVSGQHERSQMNIRRNVFAKPQIYLEINSPDSESLASFISNNHERIIEELHNAEITRIQEYNTRYEKRDLRSQLNHNFDLSLVFPPGYSIYVDTTDFMWINFQPPTQDRIQGVFVYQYEYRDPDTFVPDNMIARRNDFLRRYVQGPVTGSYMSTESQVSPLFHEYMNNGRYFAELRGLWKLENDFMGGPFVSITTIDETRNRVVTVEGFVYAPNEKKRNLLRQVEGIINTLEISE